MNLLFDQNISVRIVKGLQDIFPGCKQVRLEGLENASDTEIWKHARKNNYCIVTFDADFYDLSTLHGQPPKVIWLRIGNTSTKELDQLLRFYSETIKEFINSENSDFACLEIKAL